MATRIYTGGGDKGQTGLIGGQRVSKDDARVDAYGDVDELNAALGVVLAAAPVDAISDVLTPVQSLLFELGAELAGGADAMTAADSQWLESCIDAAEAELQPLSSFVLPGGTRVAAALHVARAVCRRAERRVLSVEGLRAEALVFLNRLSDLLFVQARLANHCAGSPDVPWTARAPKG